MSACQTITEKSRDTVKSQEVKIIKLSDLDERTQEKALDAIEAINLKTSTNGGITSWSKYTQKIREDVIDKPEIQKTLFLAQIIDQFVGYAVFYKNSVPSSAYCFWIAVDEAFRGQGLALSLQLKIFEDKTIRSFSEHIAESNTSALRVFKKFSEMGFTTDEHNQIGYYIVTKKDS